MSIFFKIAPLLSAAAGVELGRRIERSANPSIAPAPEESWLDQSRLLPELNGMAPVADPDFWIKAINALKTQYVTLENSPYVIEDNDLVQVLEIWPSQFYMGRRQRISGSEFFRLLELGVAPFHDTGMGTLAGSFGTNQIASDLFGPLAGWATYAHNFKTGAMLLDDRVQKWLGLEQFKLSTEVEPLVIPMQNLVASSSAVMEARERGSALPWRYGEDGPACVELRFKRLSGDGGVQVDLVDYDSGLTLTPIAALNALATFNDDYGQYPQLKPKLYNTSTSAYEDVEIVSQSVLDTAFLRAVTGQTHLTISAKWFADAGGELAETAATLPATVGTATVTVTGVQPIT